MNTEPSTPPENPQDEIPPTDRRTVIKASLTGLVLLVVIGGIFLSVRTQFASPDASKTYASVADARRHVIDFKTAKPAPATAFTEVVPVDARTARRVTTSFADFKGGPVFVAMWATWCRPCHAEMRALDRLAPELRRRGLTILPIMTADKAGMDGARFFYRNENIVNLPIFLDQERRTLSALGVGNLPVGAFIDAEGRLLAVTENLDLQQEPAQDLLRIFAETGKLPS